MRYTALTLLSAAALATAARLPHARADTLLYPYRTYRYWAQSGDFKEDPQDQLLVVKNGKPAEETTTIVTFDIGANLEGRKCKLLFDLWERDVSTGSQQADVFTATKPTGASAKEGEVSIQAVAAASKEVAEVIVQSRDEHVGRIKVTAPGVADWIMSYGGYPEFDCPAGEMAGFEFVGVSDEVAIRWDIGVTGPRVQVL
ncbi:hypothetical protein P170DRAFT_425526 [Aspergillus steynii IBT 23096]|uniref:Ubiquitin 3 binding protein But2 C-terminal domain-containing protein n=1 Tax=Aspergillus steynii IBT 23096 TaxID=1392250 RepID=A0A2I2GEL8_9EURO|nr:uncharacterized protein P170DRAFT_425526 [Aspergillus steynii IBT 23096]PLB51281.1 hypothetical protein P170DRAFT_425526 [Aspergillus steynii IBT 23096]